MVDNWFMTKELNFQEQAFLASYLKCFRAPEAARLAGYAESVCKTQAWSWISITGCPPNKRHLRDAIQAEITKRFGDDPVDAEWVLKRARLIAGFNIAEFLTINDDGDAVYDFSSATKDDWYCIEEYMTEQSYRKAAGGEQIPVDKLKIKTASKVRALELIGKHTSVQAFIEKVEHSGEVTQVTMTAEEYQKARQAMINSDDC